MFVERIKMVFVGTGVLDRPLTQQNLRTVREAGPYAFKIRSNKIKSSLQHRNCPCCLLCEFGFVEFFVFHLIHRKRSPFPSRGRLWMCVNPRLLLEEKLSWSDWWGVGCNATVIIISVADPHFFTITSYLLLLGIYPDNPEFPLYTLTDEISSEYI